MNPYFFVSFIILSFLPSLFWLFFYYYYSPRFTTPRNFLFILFFSGAIAAIGAAFVERGVLQVLPDFILETFQKYFYGSFPYQLSDVFTIFFLMFLFVAPVEELSKFFLIILFLKKKPEHFNQIIDGIKFGIVTGLGFAVVENGIYFSQPLFQGQIILLLKLFFLRFFVSTLGHSLYTGIMGYYLGLSRFYNKKRLLLKGLFLAIFTHAVFNFFLFVDLGFFSLSVLIIMLFLMMKWLWDQRNLGFVPQR